MTSKQSTHAAETAPGNEETVLPPYRRADLQALITKVYKQEITDEEFHNGIDRIINSWKMQFAQPEHPNGWRVAKGVRLAQE